MSFLEDIFLSEESILFGWPHIQILNLVHWSAKINNPAGKPITLAETEFYLQGISWD